MAKLFRGELASDLIISQDINSEDPIKWLEDIRNAHSYKLAPFPDPVAPAYFAKFAARPRAVIAAYLRDPLALAFDPEHAIVAYPLLALSHLDAEIARLGLAPNILIENHCIKNLSAHQCFVAEFRTTFSRIQFGPAA